MSNQEDFKPEKAAIESLKGCLFFTAFTPLVVIIAAVLAPSAASMAAGLVIGIMATGWGIAALCLLATCIALITLAIATYMNNKDKREEFYQTYLTSPRYTLASIESHETKERKYIETGFQHGISFFPTPTRLPEDMNRVRPTV